MKDIILKDFINICDGELLCGDDSIILDDISKDTRTITSNSVYLAIKGENYDGNLFIGDAFKNGAKAVIIDNKEMDYSKYLDKTIVYVNNTIDSLQKIAKYKRSLYDIPVIAITGSVGKTSTKDLIYEVLSRKYNVLKTLGNENNHIGLPLTIMRLKDHEMMVIEMGMNNIGEISLLSKIAKPTLAIITNIGTAHIGILGSRENILKAKLEILDGMDKEELIINNDSDLLYEYGLNRNIISVGTKKATYQAININNDCSSFDIKNHICNINNHYLNEAYIINELFGYAIAKYFNVSDEDYFEAINNYNLSSKRLETIETNKNITIINDSYNANYDSMKVALDYISNIPGTRKIAVLGDMLELGDYSISLHHDVGIYANNKDIDVLVTVGQYSKEINNVFTKEKYHFNNNDDCISFLNGFIKEKDTLIFKASRNMYFSNIIEKIK